jgi:predicted transcriptional regulator
MQDRLLLSIKPKFAHAILDGRKRFEFRRALFRRKGIESVIIYSSSPEQKVIGEFRIEDILSLAPDSLWRRTYEYAGIDKAYFDRYFAGKSEAHAIKIRTPTRYSEPLDLRKDFGVARAPQSFCYVRG